MKEEAHIFWFGAECQIVLESVPCEPLRVQRIRRCPCPHVKGPICRMSQHKVARSVERPEKPTVGKALHLGRPKHGTPPWDPELEDAGHPDICLAQVWIECRQSALVDALQHSVLRDRREVTLLPCS